MEEMAANSTALPEGSIILGGRYRLIQLLQHRPRVNLYLGRHLSQHDSASSQDEEHEPLVAIRELVLTSLSPQLRSRIEQAAFEEFVSPVVLGSPRLREAGNRVRSEGDRNYLVMYLGNKRKDEIMSTLTLDELLLSEREWPIWLNLETAVSWGIQLGRMVARLHRLGVVLCDLNPAIVLVGREVAAEWAPILLVCWPPAPQFWPATQSVSSVADEHRQVFPIAMNSATNAFAAPETLKGIGDERSDVYSLGAILYLLLTHYAPASAVLRQRCSAMLSFAHSGASGSALLESLELISPYLFDGGIPPMLENVLMRALAFDPGERYASAFEFAEALEAIY